MTSDIEFSEEMFLITKETSDAYLKTKTAPPQAQPESKPGQPRHNRPRRLQWPAGLRRQDRQWRLPAFCLQLGRDDQRHRVLRGNVSNHQRDRRRIPQNKNRSAPSPARVQARPARRSAETHNAGAGRQTRSRAETPRAANLRNHRLDRRSPSPEVDEILHCGPGEIRFQQRPQAQSQRRSPARRRRLQTEARRNQIRPTRTQPQRRCIVRPIEESAPPPSLAAQPEHSALPVKRPEKATAIRPGRFPLTHCLSNTCVKNALLDPTDRPSLGG